MLRYGDQRPAPVLRRRPALPEAVPLIAATDVLRIIEPSNDHAILRILAARSCRSADLQRTNWPTCSTMAGLEVEEVRSRLRRRSRRGRGAKSSRSRKHPNADRLNVCQVDVGTGTLLNIVCGAPNVRAGMKALCAMVGAVLPPGADGKPFEIKVGKLRGVESQGMLCSASELKLSEDQRRPAGTAGRCAGRPEHPRLPGSERPEIHDQAHARTWRDCLSVLGVAREVSALTGAPLTPAGIAHRSPATSTKSCR